MAVESGLVSLGVLIIDFGAVNSIVSFISSMAIVLGAIFVVFEIRDNRKMIQAATEQAKAAAIQAESSAEQTKQNIQIADMDIIMRLYEFANTREVQTAWLTILNSNLGSFEEFQKLPKEEQVSFYQIASLFESIGVLLDRGIISLKTVDDMFLPQTAWQRMEPFLDGLRARSGSEAFPFFKMLNSEMDRIATQAELDKKRPGVLSVF
jgi:hypothetical protein